MESASELKIANGLERERAMLAWLKQCGLKAITWQGMPGNASTRHYFRVQQKGQSFVVMDAREPQENIHAFVAIAKTLSQLGLMVPEIIAADLEQRFLLITDFGDATFLKALNKNNVHNLYHGALTDLSILQSCDSQTVLNYRVPSFSAEFMCQEWEWHKEWFLNKLLGLKRADFLDESYLKLVNNITAQPQVFMHRDYHSANLMVLPDNKTGILDFQDAFVGPVTYDAVSLLRDCYIDWPDEWVEKWAYTYLQLLQNRGLLTQINPDEFKSWFDYMSMQRHLKALLTFARKHIRDHQAHYLHFVTRTLNYLLKISQGYAELRPFYDYYNTCVLKAFQRVES